jgi:hypothetical protein
VRITPFSQFSGETLTDASSDITQYFVATIASTIPSPSRSFTGPINPLTWLREEGPCLYMGDSQAFRAGEISFPSDVNDGVIEAIDVTYMVSGPFDDPVIFGMFDENMCT